MVGAVSNFQTYLDKHCELLNLIRDFESDVLSAAQCVASSLSKNGKLLLVGNGGSAADCQHIAAEFVGKLVHDRKPLAAIALTVDSSALTCISNDYGYPSVFARQLEGLGNDGDVLLMLSTSGNSSNIVNCIDVARSKNIRTISFLGNDGGALHNKCDYEFTVPSDFTAHIQEMHILLGHILCFEVERLLGLSK